jgi:hypothetical protein
VFCVCVLCLCLCVFASRRIPSKPTCGKHTRAHAHTRTRIHARTRLASFCSVVVCKQASMFLCVVCGLPACVCVCVSCGHVVWRVPKMFVVGIHNACVCMHA